MPNVAVINGSLRQASLNGRLARALAKLAAPRLTLTPLRIDDLALFNQDMESNLPAPVNVAPKDESSAASSSLPSIDISDSEASESGVKTVDTGAE